LKGSGVFCDWKHLFRWEAVQSQKTPDPEATEIDIAESNGKDSAFAAEWSDLKALSRKRPVRSAASQVLICQEFDDGRGTREN
jgi:hypothetical protein